MEALHTIDENWRPTSNGWVSSPWVSLSGLIKYILCNILINQKTGLGVVGFEIKNILYFLVC